jgi:hypothetical protein
MKKGTGSRVKVVMDVKTPVTVPIMPGIPPRKKYAATILTMRKAKAMGIPVSNKKTMPPKSKEMTSHHSMGYLPAFISISLLHAILKNCRVRRMKPMGMMMKTADFGTVTALTSVTPFIIQSHIWTIPKHTIIAQANPPITNMIQSRVCLVLVLR